MVVLTAGKVPNNKRMALMYREHVAAHERLAASVPTGQHLEIPDATHHMELTAPLAVVEAIRGLAAQTA